MRVTDNVRVATVQARVTGLGGFALDTTVLDTTVATASTDVTRSFTVALPASSTGQRLAIAVTATDATGNAGSATVNVVVQDPQPPVITVKQPLAGATVAAGAAVTVIVKATDPSGIAQLGTRLFQTRDALGNPRLITISARSYATRVESKTDTFALLVPDTTNPGTYTIHAFAVDGSPGANVATSPDISIQVVDTLLPFGTFLNPPLDSQIVAGDSLRITFRAQDRAGVDSVVFTGFQQKGDSSLGTDQQILRFNSKKATFVGQPDSVVVTRFLNAVLSDSTTSDSVFLRAQIFDVGGNVTTVLRRVRIVAGPFVRVGLPVAGARLPVGVPVTVKIVARDPDSVRTMGFIATGVAAGRDSIVRISPLKVVDSILTLSLPVSASAVLGADTITPFATDRIGNRFLGTPIVISFQDTVAPTDTIKAPVPPDLPVTVGDSFLATVRVLDNRGVSSLQFLGVAYRGNRDLGTDTAVTRFATRSVVMPQRTDTTISRYMRAVPEDSTSETVYLIVVVQDSSGNTRRDSTTVVIVDGPRVRILTPTDSALVSAGKSVSISVRGIDPNGVRILGWSASGVATKRDSVIATPVASALADTLVFTSSFLVPLGTPAGAITVVPFGRDSVGDPSGTVPGITLIVQTISTDVTPPLVQFNVGARVEVDDTVTVRANDPSGIKRIGFIARNVTTGAIIRADSLNFVGNVTDITQGFALNVDTLSVFPAQITIEAFALDSVNNRGVSSFTVAKAAPADAETLTVVAGKTIALPLGGAIGDAIYNRNRNELYLTNTTLSRLEIFQLTDSSFAPAIPVGSRPAGLALWPRDTLGNNADTVIVANSGGTNLSIVDVSAARVERRRHRLPNYLVQTVKTQTNAGGGVDIIITEYSFSDRPFYVGAVCDSSFGGTCIKVQAIYSTTPTLAQSSPFTNRGYLAWDELTAPAATPRGHLFYETAIGGKDTLQIIAVRDSAPGAATRDTVLGAGLGTLVTLDEMAYRDSTFVRNSGDFNHTLMGEGGIGVTFARALMFDARSGIRYDTSAVCNTLVGAPLNCTGQFDRGVSESVHLRDFVSNRASVVHSIATNFNGRTNLVRADSIYAFDFTLRQTGLMPIGSANAGMDFPRENNFDAATRGTGGFGGVGSPNNRLLFAARPDANIEVFDTYFYAVVATIPTRDPIIGPIRVATNGSGQRILVGVTANGIVIVRVPNLTNPFPVARP